MPLISALQETFDQLQVLWPDVAKESLNSLPWSHYKSGKFGREIKIRFHSFVRNGIMNYFVHFPQFSMYSNAFLQII